jgi:hypothetical protein
MPEWMRILYLVLALAVVAPGAAAAWSRLRKRK